MIDINEQQKEKWVKPTIKVTRISQTFGGDEPAEPEGTSLNPTPGTLS